MDMMLLMSKVSQPGVYGFVIHQVHAPRPWLTLHGSWFSTRFVTYLIHNGVPDMTGTQADSLGSLLVTLPASHWES